MYILHTKVILVIYRSSNAIQKKSRKSGQRRRYLVGLSLDGEAFRRSDVSMEPHSAFNIQSASEKTLILLTSRVSQLKRLARWLREWTVLEANVCWIYPIHNPSGWEMALIISSPPVFPVESLEIIFSPWTGMHQRVYPTWTDLCPRISPWVGSYFPGELWCLPWVNHMMHDGAAFNASWSLPSCYPL